MSLSFWNSTQNGDALQESAEIGDPEENLFEEQNPSLNLINVVNALGYIINTVFTYGVGTAGIFGLPTNADLSKKYQTLVTPKSSAFIIWAVIFSFQAIFVVLQLFPRYRGKPVVQQGVGYWYLIVCLLQVGWTFSFAYEVVRLSLVVMLLLWVSLMVIVYLQNKTQNTNNFIGGQIDFWFFRFPFAIHGGWITAASALNVNVVAVYEKETESTQLTIAIISLAVLHAFSVWHTFGYTRPNFVIPSVLAWANFWIYQELKDPRTLILITFSQSIIDAVSNSALCVSLIILAQLAVRFVTFAISYCRGASYLQKYVS